MFFYLVFIWIFEDRGKVWFIWEVFVWFGFVELLIVLVRKYCGCVFRLLWVGWEGDDWGYFNGIGDDDLGCWVYVIGVEDVDLL